jgi:uncharacterized membrane protein
MNRVEFKHLVLRPPARFDGLARIVRYLLFVLFVFAFLLVWIRILRPGFLAGAGQWPEGLLLVLAAATSLAALRLPAQNVMGVGIVIAVGGGAVQTLGALTGMPFGPYSYTKNGGQQLFYPLPWAVPFLWVALLLNARQLARLVLRPWRGTQNYGFWLLAVSVLLVVLLDLAFEPFATIANQYWVWKPTRLPSNWYGTPWVNFLGWAVSALVIFVWVTPLLLNKKPGEHSQDLHPLWMWLMLNALFLTSAITHRLGLVAFIIAGQTVLVAGFALWSASYRSVSDSMGSSGQAGLRPSFR